MSVSNGNAYLNWLWYVIIMSGWPSFKPGDISVIQPEAKCELNALSVHSSRGVSFVPEYWPWGSAQAGPQAILSSPKASHHRQWYICLIDVCLVNCKNREKCTLSINVILTRSGEWSEKTTLWALHAHRVGKSCLRRIQWQYTTTETNADTNAINFISSVMIAPHLS